MWFPEREFWTVNSISSVRVEVFQPPDSSRRALLTIKPVPVMIAFMPKTDREWL